MLDSNKVTPIGFVFWPYGYFPYVLGSPATENLGGNRFAISDYGPNGRVTAHCQMEFSKGAKVKAELSALSVEYFEAQSALTQKFKEKALAIAPFLAEFKTYQEASQHGNC